jgi:hypothetical protein
MRTAIVVALFLPIVLVANEPRVSAPILGQDVYLVRELIAATTPDEVTYIGGIIDTEFVPGAIPRDTYRVAADGTEVHQIMYERADLLWVVTTSKTNLHIQYKVQKSPDGWKIISKGPPP